MTLEAELAAVRAQAAHTRAPRERADRTITRAAKHGLGFPALTDPGNAVARQFRLVPRIPSSVLTYQLANGNDAAAFNGSILPEVPLPASYVIDSRGTVRWAYVNGDYTGRVEPADVVAAVRAIAAA